MMNQAAPPSPRAHRAPTSPGLPGAFTAATLTLTLLTLAACSGDDPQVQQQTVPDAASTSTAAPPATEPDSDAAAPSPATPSAAHEPAAAGGSGDRLVAALVEHNNGGWIFRLLGPAADVATEAQHFVELLQSVHFHADTDEPHYDRPDPWQPDEQAADVHRRYAVTDDVELTVRRASAAEVDPLPTVNRWRRELDLSPIDRSELDQYAMPMPVGELELTIVDLTAAAPASDSPDASPTASAEAASSAYDDDDPATVAYDVPAGWLDREPGGMRLASLAVVRDEQAGDISIVSLTGDGGGMLANVNRWREQLQLAPVGQADLDEFTEPTEIDHQPATLVDLTAADGELRMLVGVQTRSEQTYFVRMIGPAALVADQHDTFEDFLRSIRFTDDAPSAPDAEP